MSDFNLPKIEIPPLATGSVIPPQIDMMILKEEEKKRIMRRERWIGAGLGVAGSALVTFTAWLIGFLSAK